MMQFNIRIPRYVVEYLTEIADRQGRTVSAIARRLLIDANFSYRGHCICCRSTPGRGPSGMQCIVHGDDAIASSEWNNT